jgi:ribonuclease VapC
VLYILDASALLAVLNSEGGKDIVVQTLDSAIISAVNGSETLKKLIERGVPPNEARALLHSFDVPFQAFDEEISYHAAQLWPITRAKGISFADRACLATAIVLSGTAITADRAWLDLKLPCPIEVIR